MWMISHPLFGLCRTPTILWIRSIATLCWKVLKPVNQRHIPPVRRLHLWVMENPCTCWHAQPHTHTHRHTLTQAHTPRSLGRSVTSRELMTQPQDCRFTHAALWTTSISRKLPITWWRLLRPLEPSTQHLELPVCTHAYLKVVTCGEDAYRARIDPSSGHSAAPAGAWRNPAAQHTDRGREDRSRLSLGLDFRSKSFCWDLLCHLSSFSCTLTHPSPSEQTAGRRVISRPGSKGPSRPPLCRHSPTCTTTPPLPLYLWSHRTSTGTLGFPTPYRRWP